MGCNAEVFYVEDFCRFVEVHVESQHGLQPRSQLPFQMGVVVEVYVVTQQVLQLKLRFDTKFYLLR